MPGHSIPVRLIKGQLKCGRHPATSHHPFHCLAVSLAIFLSDMNFYKRSSPFAASYSQQDLTFLQSRFPPSAIPRAESRHRQHCDLKPSLVLHPFGANCSSFDSSCLDSAGHGITPTIVPQPSSRRFRVAYRTGNLCPECRGPAATDYIHHTCEPCLKVKRAWRIVQTSMSTPFAAREPGTSS